MNNIAEVPTDYNDKPLKPQRMKKVTVDTQGVEYRRAGESIMEKYFQNTVSAGRCLALMCCALWGSAFPCIKIGYEWLQIEGAGSQILFAGYRFYAGGSIHIYFRMYCRQ